MLHEKDYMRLILARICLEKIGRKNKRNSQDFIPIEFDAVDGKSVSTPSTEN